MYYLYVYIYIGSKQYSSPNTMTSQPNTGSMSKNGLGSPHNDDNVYLINYNMAVDYKIYLHTNTDQPEQYKYKMKSIRKIYSWLGKI
jgi:hypothetical protein